MAHATRVRQLQLMEKSTKAQNKMSRNDSIIFHKIITKNLYDRIPAPHLADGMLVLKKYIIDIFFGVWTEGSFITSE